MVNGRTAGLGYITGWGSNSGVSLSVVGWLLEYASACLTALALKPTGPIVVVSDENIFSISIEYETGPTSRNTSLALVYFLISSNPHIQPHRHPTLP